MFRVRPLSSERSYPSSIPLVLPFGHEYDVQSRKIRRKVQSASAPSPAEDHLTLFPDAVRLLEGIDKPVAILSICGPYRSGKSSFLSRLLGIPNAFQVSNDFSACTRGIWIATSGLECDDFIIVVLDTEGTDGICSGSELLRKTKVSVSILVLTTVLSTCLIYNSMQIPRRSDLDTMSCFTELASSSSRLSGSNEVKTLQQFFPRFLWLLRDATLLLEDEDGRRTSLSDYIRSYLQTESDPANHDSIAHTLLNLFPSFECKKLPYPSKEDLQNDFENSSDFSCAFRDIQQHILQTVRPKRVRDSDAYYNGRMIATLAAKHLDSLNSPNAVPDVANGWRFAIKHNLTKKLDDLVSEYECEMKAELKDCLPMEEDVPNEAHLNQQPPVTENPEIRCLSPKTCSQSDDTESPSGHTRRKKTSTSSRSKKKPRNSRATSSQPQLVVDPIARPTLLSIHQSVYAAKREELCKAINRFMSISSAEKDELLRDFEKQIVRYDDKKVVIGGILYCFMQKNQAESYKQCRSAFDQLAHPLFENLEDNISTIRHRYHSTAVGPAKNDVYETKLAEFEYHARQLSPSAPTEITTVGRAPYQLKIQWSSPNRHKQAVQQYEVQIRNPNMDWRTIATTEKHSLLVCGLKSSTQYLFRVRGLNARVAGEWTAELEAKTRLSKTEQAAAVTGTFVCGTLGAPLILTGASFSYMINTWKESRDGHTKALCATGIVVGAAMLPFVVSYYAITSFGPVVGIDMAKIIYNETKVSEEDNLSKTNSERIDVTANTRSLHVVDDVTDERSHRDEVAPELSLTLPQDFAPLPEDDSQSSSAVFAEVYTFDTGRDENEYLSDEEILTFPISKQNNTFERAE